VYRSLQRGDAHDIDDIVRSATTAQIVGRFGEALQDRAEGRRAAEALAEFVRDVAGAEIGEHQDVRAAADRAAGRLLGTGLPGAFLAATSGTNAASPCNSPSTHRSGARCRTISVARATFSASGWLALPLVEKLRSATRGSFSKNSRALAAL